MACQQRNPGHSLPRTQTQTVSDPDKTDPTPLEGRHRTSIHAASQTFGKRPPMIMLHREPHAGVASPPILLCACQAEAQA